jgi:SulP family sulfate permease
MRHIAQVKRSDLLTLSVAFFGTLLLGIELGIAVAVLVSMLVVFARMSKPFTAVLGKVPGTLSYRNIDRFPDAELTPGVRVIRMDAALSFVNASFTKQLILEQATLIEGTIDAVPDGRRVLVLNCSGINDLDVTGAGILDEVLDDLEDRHVELYLSDVKGPTRDVLLRAHLWERFAGRVYATTDAAVRSALGHDPPPPSLRAAGIDERGDPAR